MMNTEQKIEIVQEELAKVFPNLSKTSVIIDGKGNITITGGINNTIPITQNIYNLTAEAFREYIISELKKARPKHLNHIPLALPPKVIGRQADLEKVEALLFQDNALVIVNGIGGIGKTVLSHYYWQQCQHHYTHLLWLKGDGNLDDTLLYDYDLHEGLGVAEEMKYHLEAIRQPQNQDAKKQALAFLYKSLKNVAPKALMLIDNATDENHWTIKQWKTTFANFHILVTSRETFANVKTYQLGYLSELEAIELFYLYYDPENTLPHDDAIVAEIVQKAGYHTLTIELLAMTLKDSDELTLATLLEKLEEHLVYLELKKKVAIDANYTQSRDYIDSIIEFTFDLSRLKKHEYALHLLTQLSILPSYNLRAADLKEIILYEASKDLETEMQYTDNLQILWKAGWVERHHDDDGYFYNCHAVIQEVTRKKQQPSMENCGEIVGNLNNIIYNHIQINALDFQKLLPYVLEMFKYLIEEHLEIATLYSNIGVIYQSIGDYLIALSFTLNAIKIKENVLSNDNSDLAISYSNIAIIYNDLGNYEIALSFALKAIEIDEKTGDSNQLNLAISYNNIAIIYSNLGNYEIALNFDLKAITIREKVLSNNHPVLASSYSNIADTYKDLGDYQTALNFELKAIAIREKVLSNNHPHLAISYSNISTTYAELEKYQTALNFILKSIAIREKVLDKNHSSVAISYHNLASIYYCLKDFENSTYFEKKAIIILLKSLPDKHPKIKNAVNKMMNILEEAIKAEGQEKYSEVLQWFLQTCGEYLQNE